ncbi:MAG TPA: hypothetical protein VF733_03275 [Candidatus Saccharimonadales bacterium]
MGKYFIEEPGQLETLQQMCEDHTLLNPRGIFEVREWIPTPSNSYTTYRVLTGPTGGILAAGLIYNHNKDSDRRIPPTYQNPPLLRSSSTIYFWGKSFSGPLEDPHSDYFLNSRDIRSNIHQGGKCIPLVEHPPREISHYEKEVLAAHGIDPDLPLLPRDIVRQAPVVGRVVGKVAGMVIGQDYIQHRDTQESYLIDINTGPGEATWLECHGGRDFTSPARAITQMSIAGLLSIAGIR